MDYRITEEDRKFMKMAIAIAEENPEKGNGGPFGAVITHRGKVIASSGNRVLKDNDPTGHAEIAAIRMACSELQSFQLEECNIYCSCEPCPMCLGAIYWARPERVFYANTRNDAAAIGFDDNFIYKEIEKDLDKRQLPFIQLMEKEAKKAFKMWDAMENKIVY